MLVAVLGAAVLAAQATAAEPADDHAGGAVTIGPGARSLAAIDRPADRDWYAVDLARGDDFSVTARRVAGDCGAGALRLTVLNPEAHAIRWATVVSAAGARLELPKGKPGRYLVELDTAGEPGCGGLIYRLSLDARTFDGNIGSGNDAQCRAARGQLRDDRKAQSEFKRYLKSPRAKAVKRYRGYLRKVAALLKQDRRDVSRYCPKR